ncbi:Gfo/Idh/MocA family protein [Catenuloplanes indicus]|uniref:Dehydrogenase n=1 Tax=Catenuloplanes indicus TaxID=137267 RepID=A0AAE3W4U2_9ACTN|nr:Gfo/Idh/MocA family oxidoreductase [Catenuloplanes indicus]MDQ0368744.1 putative dehydrogenase [Catenuloplanes indicus]
MRFGLLGTGYWATETQGTALAAHPEADLVGVWGRDTARTRAAADRFGITAYDDVDALIADVDAVSIALPPDIQADLATRAATVGRHLLLDKPLSLSLAAADRLVAAVEKHDVASVVFFTSRFQPPVEEFIREAVSTGGWTGARADRFASIYGSGSPYADSSWRKEAGGLWDVGPHALAVLLAVLGMPTSVTALPGVNNTTHVLVKHMLGAVSSLTLTLEAPEALKGNDTVFHGTAGAVEVPAHSSTSVEAFGSAISQLLQAAQHRAPHPCGVHFGRLIVAVLEAAETSIKESRTVTL